MPSTAGGVAFLAATLAVLVAVGVAGIAAPAARAAPATPFSVSLSATPSYGVPPLTVAFDAAVSSGSPTLYDWTFGDGATYVGTNASAASPSHVYELPGLYNASVTISESSGSNSSSIEIHVVATALSAVASASAPNGIAPLTETFSATVHGGSGTFVNFSWNFGNGGTGEGDPVQYTYEIPGTFHVRFEVYDSDNDSANASVWVNVTAADSAPAGSTPGSLSYLPWALGGAAIGALAVWTVVRYRSRSGPAPPPARPAADSASSLPAPTLHGSDAPTVAPPSPAPAEDGAAALAEPSLRVSQRVILHLAQQGWLGDNEVATIPFTQGGMSAALEVPQTSLTNVLRRLMAAGVVTQDVRHVRGRDRRLKVYRLTPKGQALARDLLHPPR